MQWRDEIKYIPHSAIDPVAWDRCVEQTGNSRIYGSYDYLEHMARGQWDALIAGDYQMVMPLPWRKKYGISYLYQPAFVAAGGVFGEDLSPEIIHAFIQQIPPRFRLIEIPLNAGNAITMPGLFLRQNFVLDLSKSYTELYSAFRESTKRNIKKAKQAGCRLTEIGLTDVIELNRTFMSRLDKIDEEDYANFTLLYQSLLKKGRAKIFAVEDSRNNVLASAVFFFDANRAYYILVGNTANGKTLGASHFLINAVIEEYAEKHLLLDFEGSDVRSLAFFYSSFGAIAEPYPALRINRLPRLLKWLK